MSIEIDAGLLAVVVEDLGITIPVRSVRRLKDGSVEVWTRDGLQVWKPLVPPEVGPKVKTAPKSVSNPTSSGAKPRAPRKRAAPAKKEVASETVD